MYENYFMVDIAFAKQSQTSLDSYLYIIKNAQVFA